MSSPQPPNRDWEQADDLLIRRGQTIAALYRGTTLRESFHAIAKAYASDSGADRVSLLRIYKNSRCELIATSGSDSVDRRARLANLLEAFAQVAQDHNEPIQFIVGNPPTRKTSWQPALDRYLVESNCRRLEAMTVCNSASDGKPIAMLVTEWFTVSPTPTNQSLRSHIDEAVRTAIDRDAAAWSTIVTRAGDSSFRQSAAWIGTLLLGFALTLWLVPARFTVPADGRVVPSVHRRVFAPADAIISKLSVRNGQSIRQGGELLAMRSASIDLSEEQLRGDLITAKTRLAAIGASKSSSRRTATDANSEALTASSNEESLKTEIAGLEKQLALVVQQQRELTIASPIDGNVDRWDLEQSLLSRPVAQGQYLLDIYDPTQAWNVELDMIDKQIGYLHPSGSATRKVRFRLQSHPSESYEATITEIAESAQIDAQGRSLIRLKCTFTPDPAHRPAIGATVWAEIDCGKRSLGFVWLRGLIEWFEQQAWY